MKQYTFILSRGRKSAVVKIARHCFLRACLEVYKYDRLRGYGVRRIVDENGKVLRIPSVKEIISNTTWSPKTEEWVDVRDFVESLKGTPEQRENDRQEREMARSERFKVVRQVA